MVTIVEFFRGKNIFITGGSGFIGKVLIEKLLRSCPGVGDIYVLLRRKKGKTLEDRMNYIKNLALFDVVRKMDPTLLNKIIAVEGDSTQLRLGMSEEDRQRIIDNVHIIYNSAASVRFDDNLKYAIILNVRGTRETVELASEVKNLSVFVHVSTTYCNTDKEVIEEKIYPPHADWRASIKIVEELDEKTVNALASKYISPLPNTYTFAKSLAEHTVEDMCRGKFPAIILRPSVVISTLEDPFPGWNDNFNGPVGLLVAGGKGLLRIVLGHPKVAQDFITVDLVAKSLILATYDKAVNNSGCEEIDVYNCCKGDIGPVPVEDIINMGADLIQDSPFSQILWYPNFSMTSCWYNYYIQVVLFHMVPAFFIDLLLRIIGKKPMLFSIQRKIYIANVVLEYFMRHTWKFNNSKSIALNSSLSEEDRNVFGVDEKHLVWDKQKMFNYFRDGKIGSALYILKEDFDFTRVESRRNLRRLWVLDRAMKSIFFLTVLWFFTVKVNILRIFCLGLENYIRRL